MTDIKLCGACVLEVCFTNLFKNEKNCVGRYEKVRDRANWCT